MKTPLLLISILFVLAGCGLKQSTNEATSVANKFNKHLKEHQFDELFKMLDNSIMEKHSEEEITAAFELVHSFGKIKSIKKGIGFNTNINNNVTTVELNYTITCEKRTFNEQLILVRTGDKPFKVSGYHVE